MSEKIVIIGSGWAGCTLAHGLDDKRFDITVISPDASFPYHPLLASVACGLFDFSIAEEPIRRKASAIKYLKARVSGIDFDKRSCVCTPEFASMSKDFKVAYDRIVIAPGCTPNTFGTEGVAEHAMFMKNVQDAMMVRRKLGDMLEMASIPTMTEEEQRKMCHIIVVGGGPTGVEVSAELYDMIARDLDPIYPHLRGKITIALHDVADQILPQFDEKLAEYALKKFKRKGVEIKTGSHITKVTSSVMHTKEDGEIGYGMLIWATGNKQVSLIDNLDIAKSEKLPRILTNDHLHIKRANGSIINNAYALGDAADVDGKSLPTTAEVATQKAEYLIKLFNNGSSTPFSFKSKATIAYIGSHDGVVSGQEDWSGSSAWLAWRSKSLQWAKSPRSKVMIVVTWLVNYLFGSQITGN